ncbi:MAG: response regulator [Desulfatiglandales bacterium]
MDVLVVDSDVAIRTATSELIKGWGYGVETSGTVQDTLQKAGKKAFDLVLLDISLPEMPAKELIGELKKLRPQIGVVTMTEHSTDELEKEIRTLGIIYYMSKPVNQKALKEILDHTSRKKGR